MPIVINNPTSGGTPSGSDTQIQFNDGGAFGGDSGLVYSKTTDTLTTGALIATSTIRNAGVEQIFSATKPTTRVGGSALVVDDLWFDTANNLIYFWNGTYWLSVMQYHFTAFTSFTAVSTSLSTESRIPLIASTTQNSFFLETLTRNASLAGSDVSNYWALQAQVSFANGGASNVAGASAVNLQNGVNNSGTQVINTVIQNGSSVNQAVSFLALLTKVGSAPNIVGATFTFSGRMIAP